MSGGLVSVVVPVLNGSSLLPGLLQSLEKQTYDGEWEVIVADNGSADGSPDVARQWKDRLPGLRVLDASGRRGASHARNVGVGAARGWFLAFLDHDDEADPAWLRALVERAGAAPLVAGRCDFERLNDRVRRAWYSNRTMDRLPRALGFLPFVSSSNLGMSAEALRRLGGWDESLVSGHDVDLSWRAQLAGFPIAFAPGPWSTGGIVRLWHRSPASSSRTVLETPAFTAGIASTCSRRVPCRSGPGGTRPSRHSTCWAPPNGVGAGSGWRPSAWGRSPAASGRGCSSDEPSYAPAVTLGACRGRRPRCRGSDGQGGLR